MFLPHPHPPEPTSTPTQSQPLFPLPSVSLSLFWILQIGIIVLLSIILLMTAVRFPVGYIVKSAREIDLERVLNGSWTDDEWLSNGFWPDFERMNLDRILTGSCQRILKGSWTHLERILNGSWTDLERILIGSWTDHGLNFNPSRFGNCTNRWNRVPGACYFYMLYGIVPLTKSTFNEWIISSTIWGTSTIIPRVIN